MFRQDLLFRLNTVEIELPPLRERREDIPLLLDHYHRASTRANMASRSARSAPTSSPPLSAYDWPGNVRALRHAAERAVILAEGDHYRLEDFPLPRRRAGESVVAAPASRRSATTSISSAPSGRWSSGR